VPIYWDEDEKDFMVAGELKHGTTLQVGYGNSGVLPYKFLRNHTANIKAERENTFFKIVLTPTPADFSIMRQNDPLKKPRPGRVPDFRRSTTSRGGEPPSSVQEMLRDASERARAFFRGDRAESYFSINYCVLQVKDSDSN
jgi:hypothetical protein